MGIVIQIKQAKFHPDVLAEHIYIYMYIHIYITITKKHNSKEMIIIIAVCTFWPIATVIVIAAGIDDVSAAVATIFHSSHGHC
jgi:hypothetical protein